ncbi:LPS O-antigen length regulator [Vibrio sinensis]|uniref:LPS O-antigen length regulator n=1 Tax=Vibrio sinensis TaxID=2302434 RepID=A0A3A6QD12_9VIBR|nr:Wzz/FepE/Etk N-terminal domain-containing protein [Vibrio sinensis]RJX67166.1 LPS O-antigen length regulator [Vibrio sinensis]
MNQQNLSQASIEYTQLQNFSSNDDEIDLRELFAELWRGKWLIVLVTTLFAIGGVAFALSQPNTYQASATLVAIGEEKGGGLASMAGQFGGLASLAGINLGGGGTNTKDLSLAVLKSRQFVNAFVDKHGLLPDLMAVESWNAKSGQITYNDELYDAGEQVWLVDPETEESLKPTAWEAYKVFSKAISVSEAKETGMVTLKITHFSPIIAKQWVELLIQDLNQWMKQESLHDTRKNIAYLEDQLERTNVVDMKNVFYQLIQEQTKGLMLAEVKNEFAFKTIDPAVIPEEKAGPKRALICILATLLGGMLSVAIVLVRYAFKRD